VLATAAWLAALRWTVPLFLSFPALAWFCVLFTVAGAVYLERRLARLAWGIQPTALPATNEPSLQSAVSSPA